MTARVESRWDDHGWVNVIVEGILIDPRLPMDFDQGNSARFRMNLDDVIRKVYEQGRKAGEDSAKQRARELVKWMNSTTGDY